MEPLVEKHLVHGLPNLTLGQPVSLIGVPSFLVRVYCMMFFSVPPFFKNPVQLWVAVIALITCLSTSSVQGQNSDESSLLYVKKFKTKVLSETGTSFRFELNNENPLSEIGDNLRSDLVRWVAVPPKGSFTANLVEVEWYLTWQSGEVEGPFDLEATSSAGKLPVAMVQANQNAVDVFRSVTLAPFKISVTTTTSRRNPDFERGQFVIKRGVYEVNLDGEFENAVLVDLKKVDPYLMEMGQELVLNPEQIASLSVPMTPLKDLEEIIRWNEMINKPGDAPVLYANVSTEEGFYKITPQDITKMGSDPSRFQVENIRVFANGKEVPLLVEGTKSGPFVNNSSVMFFVPKSEKKRLEWTTVWFTSKRIDSPDWGAPFRMEMRPVASPQSLNDTDFFQRTKRIFYPNEYSTRAGFDGENGRWITGSIPYEQIRDYNFEVSSYDPETSATLRVVLSGAQSGTRQYSRISVNGVSINTEMLIGRGPFERTLTIPKGILREGTNQLNVEYPQSNEESLSPILMFSFAELTYSINRTNIPLNQIIAYSKQAEGELIVSGQPPINSGNIVLDITKPFQPVPYGTSYRQYGNDRFISTSFTPENPNGRLLFTNTMATYPLPSLKVYTPMNLVSPTEGADIIVLTDDRFTETMKRYQKRRETQGYRVELVNSSAVFSTFGFGQKDDVAIHDFLKHAFAEWPKPRPEMVLFVGEASENWYQLRYPNAEKSENMIPVFGYASPSEEIRGDAAYGWVSGEGDLDDLETGRFSVNTNEELSVILDHIEQYEDNPDASPWMQRHVFFTDDEPEFDRVANRIIGSELVNNAEAVRLFLQYQPYEDYFRIRDRKRSFTMTRKITESMNDGALTATYIGHGGPNLWSGERIYHYRDLADISNNGRRPIMTAASCDTAWVDYPVPPVKRSIGEQFVSTAEGGGIALFAPVAATNSYEHDFLLRPFFEAINTRKMERLGKVTIFSRLTYMLYRQQSHVTKQYILLGDPALRIPQPSKGISAEISPVAALTNRKATFQVTGSVADLPWGTVDVKFLDPYGNECGAPQRVILANNRFSASLETPEYKLAGEYKLLIQAFNKESKKFYFAEQLIPVLDPKVSLSWAVSPEPQDNLLPAGTPVALTLSASNETEAAIDQLKLKILDATTKKTLTEVPLALAANSTRSFEFKFPLPVGLTLVESVLSYTTNDEENKTAARSDVEIRGVGQEQLSLVVPANLINVVRKGNIDQTTFELPLYNMTNAQMNQLTVGLYLMDRPEGSLVGNESQPITLDGFGNTLIKINENVIFPSASLKFELRAKWIQAEGGAEESQVIPLAVSIVDSQDVAIVPGSLRTERRDYRKSETVFVEALVKNMGTKPISNLRTGLYVRVPWDQTTLANSVNNQSTVRFSTDLAPGETRKVRLRWDPTSSDPVSTRLYVIANDVQESFEVDYSNNVGDVAVAMRRLPNLRLIPEETVVTPDFISVGSIVSIDAAFENNSVYDFSHSFIIEINAQSDVEESELIYRTTISGLLAGDRGSVQANWVTKKGYNKIYISINEEKEFGEETANDNVLYREIEFVFNEDKVASVDGFKFSPLFDAGKMTNATILANRSITIQPFPKQGDMLLFSNEYNTGQEMPTTRFGSEDDQMVLLDQGTISWTPQESPAPVSFRFPMSDQDDVTLYDLYIFQHRASTLESKPTNYYRTKLEGGEWKPNPQQSGTPVFAGRIETKDDFLDIAFAPDSVPSFCTIFSLKVVPVRGEYVSPKVKLESWPEGKFEADVETPGTSKLRLSYRLAKQLTDEDPWIPIEVGQDVPSMNGPVEVQIKCVLVGDETHSPLLKELNYLSAAEKSVALAPKGK